MTTSTGTHSPQQLTLALWTARFGAVTAEALALRDGCSVGSARARLLAAQRAGLLARERPLADQPALFTATRTGLRAVAISGVEPGRVSAANARHSIVCAWVAAALQLLYPDNHVMGERELRREERAMARPLASAALGGAAKGAALLHRPDIVLWPSASCDGRPVAVEVELTVKAPRRLVAICRAWARCRCVAGVVYLTEPEVRGPLGRAIDAARAGGAIREIPLESLGGALAGRRDPNERTIPIDA